MKKSSTEVHLETINNNFSQLGIIHTNQLNEDLKN